VKAGTDLLSAFDGIIEGKLVNRNILDLDYEGKDCSEAFISRLKLRGFVERRVGEIDVQFEERVPAFVIRNGTAYFGWVFIERFTERKSRKLFGSVARNAKGDWLIQISHKSDESVYANRDLKCGMEGERLFVME
jgi:hypothetical protein